VLVPWQDCRVDVVGALVLFLAGFFAVPLLWNAARPVIDPTRRYSPWWLPAMVVVETAPLWLAIHAGVLGLGVVLGGLGLTLGRLGGVLLTVAIALLLWIMVRTTIGVRRLRRHVSGAVQPARGPGRWRGRPVPTPPGVREQNGIAWRDSLTLDLVRPDDARTDLPVVVYVHGGGWTGGDPQRQGRDLYHALALGGWATLAIRYPFTPHVTVEDQIETVRSAVRWARSELHRHGVIPTTIALVGGSAGGHLAAMAALTAEADEQVAACVGIYGIYDMANRNRKRAHWAKIRDAVMLATVEEQPERYRAVSPIDRVHDGTPPVRVVHGTHDTLVPPGAGEQFVGVLRAAGRPVDFVPVYGAQHAFDALSSITSRTSAAVIRDWLHATVLARV
jgi:acetyl esterase/lipase